MSWENPQQPEGVNYSQDNPLKELVILLAGALVVLVVAVYALAMAAGWLARQVPFERETQWVAPFEQQFTGKPATAEETAARERLQAMANRIAQLQQMPAEMVLRVHIVDDDMVNAFASLGGHVMMTRGMLAALPHENALVAVLAHEVAHVKHRDPLVALGRGIAVMTAMGAVSGLGDGGAAAAQLQGAGLLTTLSFNRDQERAADDEALRTLNAWYGYSNGAADLFAVLAREQAGREPPAFMASHPATQERMEKMKAAQTPGALLPLPVEITAYLAAVAAREQI